MQTENPITEPQTTQTEKPQTEMEIDLDNASLSEKALFFIELGKQLLENQSPAPCNGKKRKITISLNARIIVK